MTGLRPLVPVNFNGSQAQLLVDSGAFWSMVSPASAAALKLKPDPRRVDVRILGPDGVSVLPLVSVKQFSIAHLPLSNVQFLVGTLESGAGAGAGASAGAVGLLGQDILGIADVEYDLANGAIRLMKPRDCGQAPLAYWASASLPYSVMPIDPGAKHHPIHTVGEALLNGIKIRVVFDTGAPLSTLTLAAARRAGMRPDSPGVVAAGKSSWIGLFSTFILDEAGDEEMHNVRLRFSDFSMDDGEMLIGADFFRSHRIYVANSQDKLYFTSNGYPQFDLTSMPASTAVSGLLRVRLVQPSPPPSYQLAEYGMQLDRTVILVGNH
jgi:hypothetical protein